MQKVAVCSFLVLIQLGDFLFPRLGFPFCGEELNASRLLLT